LGNFVYDLRYAIRQLLRARGFTAVAILSIGLGISATTLIFSIVYAVLLDPYPYKDTNRIAYVEVLNRNGHSVRLALTGNQFESVRNASFVEDVFFQQLGPAASLTGENSPIPVNSVFCSPNFFHFLRVGPLLGRVFTPTVGETGNLQSAATLSYDFWKRHYFGRRDVLGKVIELERIPYTIIGVMPPRFKWGDGDV
jgi:hypothetical protein